MAIFFACFSGYVVNFKKEHPLKKGTLVDYCIVQCQMPLIGLGSFLGTQANELFPKFVLFILLFLVLLYIFIISILKGIDMMRKEDALIFNQGEEFNEKAETLLESKRTAQKINSGINASVDSSTNLDKENEDEVEPIEESKSSDTIVKYSTKGIEPIDILDAIGAQKAEYLDEEINPTLEKIFAGESNHLTLDKIILV
mmetsp:Transcript_18032/g.15957  ORF Transcript_18032/g.15957 Transcript_18032/m.15957 type:complete len:199 (+) Transcript_18032:327-923(+)